MDTKIVEKNDIIYYLLIGKVCTLNDYEEIKSNSNTFKQKKRPVVIDLTRTTFTSSQALGIMVSIFESFKESGINLFMFNPRGEIKDAIELAGINQVIPIAYTEEELEHMMNLKK